MKKERLLWLASLENPGYIPVVVNFAIFFFNDMYGFFCWKRWEKSTLAHCERPVSVV